MKNQSKYFVIILLVLMGNLLVAQSRQELEKQRLKIIKDIEKTSKALDNNKKTQEKNITQLKALEEQVSSRKSLINNLQSEVKLNEKLITQNESKIQELRQRHAALKDQYDKILRINYLKKLSNSKWSYLLSSESLNNLLVRWRYIHQFDQFTKQKMKEIQSLTGEIQLTNETIAQDREKNLKAMEQTTTNMKTLEKEQKEKDALVKKLALEEDKLKANLKNREKEREKLNVAIEKIIIAALEKAREKEKSDEKLVKKKEVDNSGFAKNKGALSWPVSKGKITGAFGTHPHPTIKNVQISNNGIDFTLPSGDNVVCVYDGEVVGVTNIPGFKNMVIIKHGSYYTVYSKLDNVVISKGQQIKRGQTIGNVEVNEEGVAEVHFELWKDKSKMNPQPWFNR
ncbi:MAG TPA: peptidoglycan DD-metalloendopeptidase family protein [Saprospiraceae bacterium]|nr:peptidoglycan DD-metalloendopeptidase family protein [Saprospiraceae bacterium]MBK8827456.1 peptidoglycan DD-metalloendopeptidase family protein [Saprospiraceae bacterium]HQV66207.1 peptidoglycan DD-metalloendopeptidase family protein [Saprospiraceae bacterium]HQV96509.1 peptidoglycan DD-metalloendopeptidase family protein [Saprospiraceae bacterium]HRG39924.1 peptidoglycan DD-metalloendopeptidase family protein [Saprospiraceae bacterium]